MDLFLIGENYASITPKVNLKYSVSIWVSVCLHLILYVRNVEEVK